MKRGGVELAPGALLLVALLFFLAEPPLLFALILAVAVHESGHLAALVLCGAQVRGLRATASGLSIEYRGRGSTAAELCCAAAGPLAGGLLALLAAAFGRGDFFMSLAGISAALTVFNLLPALPLDGGRIILALCAEETAERLSFCCALALLLAGLVLTFCGLGLGLLAAGVWLMLAQMQNF